MPPVLKVNGRDLSAFLRTQPDEGMDVVDAGFQTPQFGGAPAIAEGGVFVADTTRNKEWSVPLWARSQATGAQGVNDLVEQVNLDLGRGPARVEFQPEGASQSTFFDLEAGRLDPVYSHFHHRKGWAKADLKLWTKPYGHTATMRSIVASQVWGGTQGPVDILVTGLAGDAPALGNLYCSASNSANVGAFMYGITTLPSFQPFISASKMGFAGGTTSTSASAIGARVFQSVAFPGGPSPVDSTIGLLNLAPANFCGRHRVFVLAGHRFSGSNAAGASAAVQLFLGDTTDGGNRRVTQATVIATSNAGVKLMGVYDLGEITVPSQVPGALPVGTQKYIVQAAVTFPTYTATYAMHVNGVVLVPLDHSAAIIPSYSVQGAAPNIGLLSYPQREAARSIFGGATLAQAFGPSMNSDTRLEVLMRGEPPRIPAGATQFRLMAWAFKAGGVIENPVQSMTVQLDVLERYKFFR